ncbi:uncharacterized protein LAESUDRAFT_714743 [Laetiporus sulphureus 93-53]|uniref:Uncharacterized protein n=1 Tax=Laetiporus sulphureus 93-53 TaxID=1314785 RepID=A0A165DWJ9_9APHY|nr:uncharacterized protein LAESUDRAFT_714743 [Laetiporus sulphureus 93-53]KZT05778.1 hypothetical protein LAESUDRAFT_714743 [Laetiporus sulphureus 93-53]
MGCAILTLSHSHLSVLGCLGLLTSHLLSVTVCLDYQKIASLDEPAFRRLTCSHRISSSSALRDLRTGLQDNQTISLKAPPTIFRQDEWRPRTYSITKDSLWFPDDAKSKLKYYRSIPDAQIPTQQANTIEEIELSAFASDAWCDAMLHEMEKLSVAQFAHGDEKEAQAHLHGRSQLMTHWRRRDRYHHSCLILWPQSKKANVDASHELEEVLLEDNLLKAWQWKVQEINNLSAEMQQMEEEFTSYDYWKMQRWSYYLQNQIFSTVTVTSSHEALSPIIRMKCFDVHYAPQAPAAAGLSADIHAKVAAELAAHAGETDSDILGTGNRWTIMLMIQCSVKTMHFR